MEGIYTVGTQKGKLFSVPAAMNAQTFCSRFPTSGQSVCSSVRFSLVLKNYQTKDTYVTQLLRSRSPQSFTKQVSLGDQHPKLIHRHGYLFNDLSIRLP